MAVTNQTSAAGPYVGNGLATMFPFSFAAKTPAEVAVYIDGAQVLTGFNVALDTSDYQGGSVTFAVAPAAGKIIRIASAPLMQHVSQLTDSSGATFRQTVQDELDRAAIRDIALQGAVGRAVKLPLGEAAIDLPGASARAGAVLAFDNDGLPVAASRDAFKGDKGEPGEPGSGGGPIDSVADRPALAAINPASKNVVFLRENNREGLFRWNAADLSAQVTADPRQAIYVAPAGDASGASGAWVRNFNGGHNVRWFGATGNGVADDSSAFTAAVAYLRAQAQTGFGYGTGAARLLVPKGHYFMGTTTLEIADVSLIIEGEGVGLPGGGASALRWGANTTGIRVHAQNTVGASASRTPSAISGVSIIRGLYLLGGYAHGTTPEGEYHGIQLRQMAQVEDCQIRYFQGDGLYIVADVTIAAGNSNLSYASKLTIEGCRNGIYLQGGDANACTFVHCNVSSNRQWGVLDKSFLGNAFVGCHSATNGTAIDSSGPSVLPPNRVVFSGKHYAVKFGQEAWCSTNAPSGTTANNQGWYYLRSGAVENANNVRAWASGTTYRSAGPYAATDLNSRSTFEGCYSEGDMNPSQMFASAMLLGGFNVEPGVRGLHVHGQFNGLNIAGNYLLANDGFVLKGPNGTCIIGDDTSPVGLVSVRTQAGAGPAGFQFFYNGLVAGQVAADSNALYLQGKSFAWLGANGTYSTRVDDIGINLDAGKTIRVNGTQVITARETGWTAATGTASKGAFATYAGRTQSATYVQADVQAIDDASKANSQRIKAIEDALRTHGLIN